MKSLKAKIATVFSLLCLALSMTVFGVFSAQNYENNTTGQLGYIDKTCYLQSSDGTIKDFYSTVNKALESATDGDTICVFKDTALTGDLRPKINVTIKAVENDVTIDAKQYGIGTSTTSTTINVNFGNVDFSEGDPILTISSNDVSKSVLFGFTSSKSIVNLYDGLVLSTNRNITINNGGSTINIYGGEFYNSGETVKDAYAVLRGWSGSTHIDGGKFVAEHSWAIYMQNLMTCENAEIESKGYRAVMVTGEGDKLIKNSNITGAVDGINITNYGWHCTIEGGTVTSNGGSGIAFGNWSTSFEQEHQLLTMDGVTVNGYNSGVSSSSLVTNAVATLSNCDINATSQSSSVYGIYAWGSSTYGSGKLIVNNGTTITTPNSSTTSGEYGIAVDRNVELVVENDVRILTKKYAIGAYNQNYTGTITISNCPELNLNATAEVGVYFGASSQGTVNVENSTVNGETYGISAYGPQTVNLGNNVTINKIYVLGSAIGSNTSIINLQSDFSTTEKITLVDREPVAGNIVAHYENATTAQNFNSHFSYSWGLFLDDSNYLHIGTLVTAPSQTGTSPYTYTGSPITHVITSGLDTSAMTITQNTETNVGKYTATFALNGNKYLWADTFDRENKTFEWEIVAKPLTAPTNPVWSTGTNHNSAIATWSTVSNATGYTVELYCGSNKVGTYTTSIVQYDLTSYVSSASEGAYTFKVKATSTNANYAESAQATSSALYRLTFNSNYGTVTKTVQYYKSGDTISAPVYTRTGYTFSGWATSSGSTSAVTLTTATSTDEYFAIWTAVEYTITYNLNGGTVSGNPTTYTIETETITLKNPTKSGYTFTGWTGSNGETPQTTVTIAKGSTGNKSYTANWTAIEYTITYNLNGGTVSGNPTTYTIETETITLKNPTKSGYTFTGWTGSNGETPQTTVTIAKGSTGNKSYTANWTAIEYTITYNLNGGTVTGNPTTYTIETETITLKNPTKSGYTFSGWTGSNGSTPQTTVKIAKGSTGDKSYTANWSAIEYTITYNLNGGTVSGNPTTYTIETATFTLKNPTKTGYTFAGWTGSNGETPQTTVTITKGSTGDKSYTANWTINSYTLIANVNEGTFLSTTGWKGSGSAVTKTLTYGQAYGTLPTAYREDYIFDGWFTDKSGGTQVSASTKITGNTTIYAHWTLAAVYNTTKHIGYSSLASAISGANTTGDTLVVVQNLPSTETYTVNKTLTILANSAVTVSGLIDVTSGTLTLGGGSNTLTIANAVTLNGGDLNVTNGTSITGGGVNYGTGTYHSGIGVLNANSTLNITGGTVSGEKYGIRVNAGSANISGGTLNTTGAEASAVFIMENASATISGSANITGYYGVNVRGELSMTGGTIDAELTGIHLQSAAVVSVTNGTISGGETGIYCVSSKTNAVNISGSTKITGATGINNTSTGTVTISGGTITGTTNSIVLNSAVTTVQLKLSGSPTITGSVSLTASAQTASDTAIHVVGDFTPTSALQLDVNSPVAGQLVVIYDNATWATNCASDFSHSYGLHTEGTLTKIHIGTLVSKPTAGTNSFTYDGTQKTYTPSGYDSAKTSITGNTATNVGSYNATVSFKTDSENLKYLWSGDYNRENVELPWSITASKLTKPTITGGPFTYNGSAQSVKINGFDDATMTRTDYSKTNAGTYTARVALKDKSNYTWADGTTADITYKWTINKKSLTIPTANPATYTFTGSTITAKFTNPDSANITMGGELTGVNVDTYTATATIKDTNNYQWSNKTTGVKNISWSITKKLLTVPTINSSSFTYDGNSHSVSFTGYDASTMTLGGTTSATNAGDYTATISLKDTKNYTWSDGSTSQKSYDWSITKAGLSAPTGLTWTVTNNRTTVSASWSAVSGSASYTVVFKTGNETKVTKTGLTETSHTLSSEELSTLGTGTYTFTVQAIGDSNHNNSSVSSASGNLYKLTFNANYSGGATTTQYYKAGDTISAPTLSRTGYTLKGWATTSSATTPNIPDKASTSATYYAVWKLNNYTLIADVNGGTFSSTTEWSGSGNTVTKTLTHGQAYGTLPTAYREDYIFDGWFTNKSGETQVSASTTITGNTTIYAHWTLAAVYNTTKHIGYSSLASAISGANATGDTLVVLQNLTSMEKYTIDKTITILANSVVTVSGSFNVTSGTLTLGGGLNTLKVANSVTLNGGNLKVEDGTSIIGRNLSDGSRIYYSGIGVINENSTFTMTGGSISGDDYGIVVCYGNATISGGTIKATNTSSGIGIYNVNTASIKIQGSSTVLISAYTGISNASTGTITISNANATIKATDCGISNLKGTVYVTSGTISSSNIGVDVGSMASVDAQLNVSGGLISGTYRGINDYGIINITGGIIRATGQDGQAIGDSGWSRGGDITIKNATIESLGSNGYGVYTSKPTSIAHLYITNSTIKGNIAVRPSIGVDIVGSTITGVQYGLEILSGATISDSTISATGTNGYGIYSERGIVTILSGIFTNSNTDIYIESDNFEIIGGTIGSVIADADFTVTGGIINKNIELNSSANLIVSGSPTIQGLIIPKYGRNFNYITVDDVFTPTSQIRIDISNLTNITLGQKMVYYTNTSYSDNWGKQFELANSSSYSLALDGQYLCIAETTVYNSTRKVGYADLQSAVDGADDGDILQVLKDLTGTLTLSEDKEVTVCAGSTDVKITGQIRIEAGTLLLGSGNSNNKKITASIINVIGSTSTLTVSNDAAVNSTFGTAIMASNGATVNINGNVTASRTGTTMTTMYISAIQLSDATANIYSGTITGTSGNRVIASGIRAERGAYVDIKGTGNVQISSIVLAQMGYSGTRQFYEDTENVQLYINNSNATIGSSSEEYGIDSYVTGNDGEIVINTGKITGSTYGIHNASTGKITLNGSASKYSITSGGTYDIYNASTGTIHLSGYVPGFSLYLAEISTTVPYIYLEEDSYGEPLSGNRVMVYFDGWDDITTNETYAIFNSEYKISDTSEDCIFVGDSVRNQPGDFYGWKTSDSVYLIYNQSTCFDENTWIYYWDEKKKKIRRKRAKNVKFKDKLLVWNFDKGCFDFANPLFIQRTEYAEKYTEIKFSDGSKLNVIGDHVVFNAEDRYFRPIVSNERYGSPVGTKVMKYDGSIVTIISKKTINKKIAYTNIITKYHMNCFTNGILTSTPFNNMYKIDENMKYIPDESKRCHMTSLLDGISKEYIEGLRLMEFPDRVLLNSPKNAGCKSFKEYIDKKLGVQKDSD